jgi:hypothetical protein
MSYFIPDGYIERIGAPQNYDIGGDDKWQKEVYETALALAEVLALRTVVDVGTGSGFKLMKYFRDRDTVGLDLAPAITLLRRTYPDRTWHSYGNYDFANADLVICSDVIEHVDDPDEFLSGVKAASRAWFVISTPDRALLAKFPKWSSNNGPPGNGCHVREWAFDEFRRYMDQHFEVVRHFISNREQCTQCVIARLKGENNV